MKPSVWHPAKLFDGQDCFVIGGGVSLTGFRWELLRGENVIGCNDAYLLGHEICNICCFGDNGWFLKWRDELEKFKGIVVTNRSATARFGPKWLKYITRKPDVLYRDALGWGATGGNTGITAINLALLLGAKRVYLLGFDCKRTKERSKWHNRVLSENTVKDEAYDRFYSTFARLAQKLPEVFPGCTIVSISNDTRLDMFPVVRVAKFFNERLAAKERKDGTND